MVFRVHYHSWAAGVAKEVRNVKVEGFCLNGTGWQGGSQVVLQYHTLDCLRPWSVVVNQQDANRSVRSCTDRLSAYLLHSFKLLLRPKDKKANHLECLF